MNTNQLVAAGTVETLHLNLILRDLYCQIGGIMKVEELEKFGAKLEMPKEAVREQNKIMLRALKKEFGLLGMLGIFKDTFFNSARLRKQYPEVQKEIAEINKTLEKELFIFSGLFLAIAKRLGRDEAYEFFKTKIINDMAKISIPAIYQLSNLLKCEGDVFDNFKKNSPTLELVKFELKGKP